MSSAAFRLGDVPPPPAVFLSYAREDSAAAQRIAEALRSYGVEVWFDQNELRGGDAWDLKIRGQIKEFALFMPVISAHTQERPEAYFRLEWKLAVERTHRMADGVPFLAPVVVDDTPTAEAIVPAEFMRVQWMRLPGALPSPQFVEQVKRLLHAPRKPFGPGPSPSPQAPPELNPKSVAVLAFSNLSRDPDNEYFSDGISEELLNLLAKIPGLKVSARTSAFHFKGKDTPIPEIARQLGVAYVIEGSVRRAGSQVRITAQLIDAADGFHVWSDTFTRELKDIFAVQDEIAAVITRGLRLKLGPAVRRPTVDPEAYRLCLEGRRGFAMGDPDALSRSEALFRRALEIDPDLVIASAGMAQVGLMRLLFSSTATHYITAELVQSEYYAREVLRADPSLVEPHAVLAMASLMRGRPVEAEDEFRRAIEQCSNDEFSIVPKALTLLRLGRPDRLVTEMDRASQMNPFAWNPLDQRGIGLLHCGRYTEAIESFERAERVGAAPISYAHHALALAKLGRHDEAAAAARVALDPTRKRGWLPGFAALIDGHAAWALAECGARDEAEAVARLALELPIQWRWSAGLPLARLGHHDEAFALLADVPQQLVGFTMFLLRDNPALRDDPRAADLLAKLGAAEEFKTLTKVLAGQAP